MRSRILIFALILTAVLPVAVRADTSSIVNLNGATPTPVVVAVSPNSPSPSAAITSIPVTGAPGELPLVLIALFAATGYAVYRSRS